MRSKQIAGKAGALALAGCCAAAVLSGVATADPTPAPAPGPKTSFDGNGTFAAASFLVTDAFPSALAVTDLNSDGKPDLSVACDGTSKLQLLLGFGDGTFFPSQLTVTRPGTGPVAVADLNKDGKPDLFLGDESAGLVRVLANVTP